MKVFLGHFDWGKGTKGLHSDPADKYGFGSLYYQQCSCMVKVFVKNGVKTSVPYSCTTTLLSILINKLLDKRGS